MYILYICRCFCAAFGRIRLVMMMMMMIAGFRQW